MITDIDKTERERFEAWFAATDEVIHNRLSNRRLAWSAWKARAALDAVAVPPGWRLVPVAPTQEMIRAGWIDKEDVNPDDIYGAMIAAAPQPLASAGAGEALSVDEAWLNLIEKDDRTSPEEYPDMALITRQELAEYMASASAGKVEPVAWIKSALDTLAAYETDYGEALPDDHELGRIDDSRGSPSFRIRVGHIRQLASSVGKVEPVHSVDEIVTRLYRRFKSWSQRGFGPDDVTWCEVKADVLEMIRAFTPPTQPVAVSVKPLEWESDRDTDDGEIVQDAETSIGRYIASKSGWFLQGGSGWNRAANKTAAKAAAQADYEQRIRSAIVIEPAQPDAYRQGAEEMREACARAVQDWVNRPNDCEALGFMDPETGARECALEIRGRDCICNAQVEAAEEIERVIRALPLPGDKEG